jgi:hypothetical protein
MQARLASLFCSLRCIVDIPSRDAGCRFDERLTVFEDWDFWLQLAEMTDFLHLDQVSATYRQIGVSGVSFFHFDPSVAQSARAEVFEKWSKRWSGTQLVGVLEALTQERRTALERVKSSGSYRLGRWLTYPVRRVRRWWRRLSSQNTAIP